ncbi:Molybdopterin binding protein [Trichodelitschia bisporula]|uniref:Molybdopterin binding protein n=1 Tax=Trichodelitschia bisporula TaxID=703511 RepID=A0A6G1HI55_9PEZI|nr:Molybdopterin binding protein [Trichodelitschia bisporula]
MFARLHQLARHLTRPLPNYAHVSAAAAPMASKKIHTAACLIIGDEVLGGKTVDTNSAYFAKFCFNLGIDLKRIEVIPDDEADIIECVRRMSKNYDFVCTSGGIGPTHDDITYSSIAKAFNLPLTLHDGAWVRMQRLSKPHKSQPNFDWVTESPALAAKRRMVEIPIDPARPLEEQAVFVAEDLWIPLAIVNGNVHILPGVPRLFERLLDEFKPLLLPRLVDPNGASYRVLISTPLAESAVAEFLTALAKEVEPRGVKVGSYPRWGKKHNTVTLVGRDREFIESLVSRVEKEVQGRRINKEGEDESDGSDADA